MKRGKPLQRKSEMKRSSFATRSSLKSNGKGLSQKSSLNRTTGLKSNSTLKSSAPLKSGTSRMKTKPRTQSPQEREARALVKSRSDSICEICGRREATDMAHRVGAGVGGKWRAGNLLHACRLCHSRNHDHPQNSFDHGWHLRSHQDYLEEPVLLVKDGVSRWYTLENEGGILPSETPRN